MAILVVGSVALDTIETPFGKVEEVLGGSASLFSAAASMFAPVQVIAVVGDDFPTDDLTVLSERGVDLSGVQTVAGESFRWSGRYSYDLSSRETLETRLGVFADFHPVIPEEHRSPDLLFLANIDPRLQIEVLGQVDRPRLVACDTMNYWIDGQRDALLELLQRVDILIANDSEIRQLAETPNLITASRWIQSRGPSMVVAKKGEHGAILFNEEDIFFVPGYPLEDVRDPTGAGDSFAGGFMGFLHDAPDLSSDGLRRAAVFGTALGSFAVEGFGVDRLATLEWEEIARRVGELRSMTQFEIH